MNTQVYKSIADLRPGEEGVMDSFVYPEDAFSICLQEIGLTPGTLLKVIRHAYWGDPIEIYFKGCRIVIRRAQGKLLKIQ